MDTLAADSPAAQMWGSTGTAYEGISFGLSDTISHTVQMLWPMPEEKILDIGTGTGWAARLAARRGAHVTGIDIAREMLSAAEELSEGTAPRPDFQHASAESLPFKDAAFDGIISTYGVIFAEAPSRAIAEMARVLRPGGRFALATWADEPEGYIPQFFKLIMAFSEAPPPASNPFDWGRTDWLSEAMAGSFDIACHKQTTVLYAPDPATVWEEYLRGFGPVAATHAALPDDRRADFRDAFEEMHRPYETGVGLVIPRQALLVRGTRT